MCGGRGVCCAKGSAGRSVLTLLGAIEVTWVKGEERDLNKGVF